MTHPHDRSTPFEGSIPGSGSWSGAKGGLRSTLPGSDDDPGSDPSGPGSFVDTPAPLLHRVLLAVAPALVLVVLAASAIWGDAGLLVRHDLDERLQVANRELAELERQNQRIVHELRSMERDPVVMERVVAEELGWAREDAVVYRFEPGP